MGGYGSGGHNKTHRRLESFRRVDSFAFRDFIMWDKYLSFKESVKYPLVRGDIIYYPQSMEAEFREGDSYTDLFYPVCQGLTEYPKDCISIVRIVGGVCGTYMIAINIMRAGSVQS